MHLILATLLIFQQQIGRGYWTAPRYAVQQWEYHAHSSVCGYVWKTDGAWAFETLRSQGARTGTEGEVETFEEAKSATEQDCR